MAEDEWAVGDEGGAVAVMEIVEVGAADADSAAADEDHAWGEGGQGEVFNAKVARSVEYGCLHGLGHGDLLEIEKQLLASSS
jgi:hypothetical protein